MNYKQIFQDNLRAILDTRGITQSKLAAMAGTTEATISRYLSGTHSPNIDYVVPIAKALHVSVDYLLGLSESPVPNEPPSPEMRALTSAYNKADGHSQKMVWMQLEPFMTEHEKESGSVLSTGRNNVG